MKIDRLFVGETRDAGQLDGPLSCYDGGGVVAPHDRDELLELRSFARERQVVFRREPFGFCHCLSRAHDGTRRSIREPQPHLDTVFLGLVGDAQFLELLVAVHCFAPITTSARELGFGEQRGANQLGASVSQDLGIGEVAVGLFERVGQSGCCRDRRAPPP